MENNKVNKLINKIISLRTKKGYTFENMALDLDITAAAYRKIETGDTKLTVERLFKIAEILESPLSDLLEIGNEIFQQHNNDNVTNCCQQKIENFYQENKEVYEKLIASKDEQIALLKSLVDKFQTKI
ncbi:MAG: helix-turn-helix domain-containing protein [Tannerella sp.]|jgi:transcriptional regulator with XRE-family HTH domain|nr:helix-turn-helix domain-containing protein [Tannerella sp.]